MSNPSGPTQGPSDAGEGYNSLQATGVPRNVSFAKDSNESTAYREHNPPAVLRRQVAARREMSPSQEADADEEQRRAPSFYIGSNPTSARASSTDIRDPHERSTKPALKADDVVNTNTHRASINPVTSAGSLNLLQPAAGLPNAPMREARSVSAEQYNPMAKKPVATSKAGLTPSSSSAKMNRLRNEEHNKQDEVHILVAVSGSVATIKLPQIVHKLKQIYRKRAVIQVVVTRASTTFFDPEDLPRDIKVWHDSDEWRSRQATEGPEFGPHSDQQLHIRLRRWADILLVAPCSANTLAKITYGICDNLLTSIFRVWNPEVPILLAPAMNTHMYTNPVTKLHFNILRESYPFVEILKPVEKVLVCGDIGMGGMREWTDIVQILVKRIGVALDEEEDEDSDTESDDDQKLAPPRTN